MATSVVAWPTVALGEVLRKSDEWVDIKPDAEYAQVTVRLWGKGVALRGRVMGSQMAASRQLRVHADQFILSRIDARNGAFGLVTAELDGAVVSNDFPVFNLDETRIVPAYLNWLSKTRDFVEMCQRASEGTTNRVRLKEDLFLALPISLPPLDEQRRIVARIEALVSRIAEARGLRQAANAERVAVWRSLIASIWTNEQYWPHKPIGDIATLVSGQVSPQVEPYASLPHINGEAMESGTCRLLPNYRLAKEDGVISGKYHFHSNAVLYSKIRPYLMKAVQVPFEGVCSADVYAFAQFDSSIEPRFFMYSLISPRFTAYANEVSGRTRMPKLNQEQLTTYEVAYPSRAEQKQIVAHLDTIQAQLQSLSRAQSQVDEELAALLPSLLDKAFRGEL